MNQYPYKISNAPMFEIVCSAAPNTAVPSPNGRFLAIGSDSSYLALIDFKRGYIDDDNKARPYKTFLEIPKALSSMPYIRSQTGCQYLNWNADSNLLAATNDKFGGVTGFVQTKNSSSPLLPPAHTHVLWFLFILL